VLDLIPPGRNVSIERETFPRILAEGNALYAYTTADYWIDLGRPEHYLSAHRDIRSGAMPLKDYSHTGQSVEIDPSATIGANVVLGEGCKIGARARLADCVLWDGVTVEDDAVIEESIIASRARIGAQAVVSRGSVVGHDAVIEPGTVLPEGARVGPTAPVAAR
jgi:mannose-1-phosphate guanylyltransferase